MDTMRCAMLLKKRGVRLDQEIGKYTILDILDFISEETQQKLADGSLCQGAIAELLTDSMNGIKINYVDVEVEKRMNDTNYIEGLKSKYQ